MKILNYLISVSLVLCLFSNNSLAQLIASGPVSGEVYFLSHRGVENKLYRSLDIGETATFLNTIPFYNAIFCDQHQGYLFSNETVGNISFSSNYGSSWVGIGNDYGNPISFGVEEGLIHIGLSKHSEDYGTIWLVNQMNGLPPGAVSHSIASDPGGGLVYALINDPQGDYFIYGSNNNFDDCFLIDTVNLSATPLKYLYRGSQPGELYSIRYYYNPDKIKLMYSDGFGENWEIQNEIFSNSYQQSEWSCIFQGFTGGVDEGECYFYIEAIWGNYEKGHVYVFHSTDYGRTFTVHHPVEWGGSQQPVLTNFSSPVTEGYAPLTIEWCNYSIGENLSYSWDFNNDGIVDSNEESPVYTCENPGTYSVKLHLSGDYEDSLIRQDYITVYPFPAQPQDLSAEVIDDDVYLNWQAIMLDTTLLGYNMYRDSILLTLEPITSPNYEDLNLTSDTYEYCVTAVYTYGVSEKSCVEASITVGVNELVKNGFAVFPNPAEEIVYVSFHGEFKLSVFNNTGEQILHKQKCNSQASFNVKDWPTGIYYFILESDKEDRVGKIIIK
jgi:PKD repeat protein